MMCILNALAIRKYLRYRQEIKRTFVVPAICAAVMGGVVYGLYQLLMMTVNINAIATSVSIIIGACVYFFLLLLLRGLRKKNFRISLWEIYLLRLEGNFI